MEEVDEMIILNYCRELQEICQQLDTSTNVCYATKCRSLEKLHLIIDAGMHVRDREEVIQSLLHDINSICLPVMCEYLMDSRERCRELAVQILSNIIDVFSVSDEYASCIVPIIANRLSNSSTLIEQSEEIRLSLVLLVKTIICKRSVNLTDYLEYLIQILVRTLVDPCSKVRRESCICVVELSSALPQHFHRHADFLIEPLLRTLTHKHSQIRSECVKALGSAVMHGSSRYVEIVFPHLSRRLLFDTSPVVRRILIEEVGNWTLHLPDRGCHFPRLISLVLTSITDEIPENRALAEALWFQVGEQYVKDNESNLMKFTEYEKPIPIEYPSNVKRPPVGCRILACTHLPNILPAVITDLCDWQEEVCIKASQLLYNLILNAEEGITQHIPMIIDGLIKCFKGVERRVVTEISKSVALMGRFGTCHLWCTIMVEKIQDSPCADKLHVLSVMLHNCCSSDLLPYLQSVASTLVQVSHDPRNIVNYQKQALACVDELLDYCSCETLAFKIFQALIAISAFCEEAEGLREHINESFDRLTYVRGLHTKAQLCGLFSKKFLKTITSTPLKNWTEQSTEWLIFAAYISEGVGSKDVLVDIFPMLSELLTSEKNYVLKFHIYKVMSKYFENSISDEEDLSDHLLHFIEECILKNLVWHAGKTASILRVAALLCFFILLRNASINDNKIAIIFEKVSSSLLDSLSDDSQDMKIIACEVLDYLFIHYSTVFELRHSVCFSSALLKRVDDENQKVRIKACHCLSSCVQMWKLQHKLDHSHTLNLFKSLLLYLDDPDDEFQQTVLSVLKIMSTFDVGQAQLLMKENQRRHTSHSCIGELEKWLENIVLH